MADLLAPVAGGVVDYLYMSMPPLQVRLTFLCRLHSRWLVFVFMVDCINGRWLVFVLMVVTVKFMVGFINI